MYARKIFYLRYFSQLPYCQNLADKYLGSVPDEVVESATGSQPASGVATRERGLSKSSIGCTNALDLFGDYEPVDKWNMLRRSTQ